MKSGSFQLGVRKKFFSVRAVRWWNNMPREAADGPSLEAFK